MKFMCGIIGYIGKRDAQPVLFDCLSKLEYRGYDSCGIAVQNGKLQGHKAARRVLELSESCSFLPGKRGIGHTRWATHGLPTDINAHPHYDCSGKIAVVHNGIVSNYLALKNQLADEGHKFLSDTDTEVIPHLIEKYFKGNLLEAVQSALSDIEGSYAIAVLMEDQNDLIVSRKDSPLILGLGEGEKYIASDVPAILGYTNQVIYLEDGDIASVSENNVQIFNNQKPVQREVHRILWDRKETAKNGFEHFMIKEIREQPRVISESLVDFPEGYAPEEIFTRKENIRDLLLLACGTSYNAGLIGKYIIEELLGIPTRVEIGSEFNHRSRLIIPSATIAITQSGETADVLIPLKKLRKANSKTLVITNVPGSSASRIAQSVIYTKAGPEIGVAATKTFVAQMIELYKIVLSSEMVDPETARNILAELRALPAKAQNVLDMADQIEKCALYLSSFKALFYVGRGINYPVALEGALKLKEISYIHAEGYAAGELKHGPFALLDKNTPVLAILSQDGVYSSMINNIKEIKARQSPLIVLVDSEKNISGLNPEKIIKVPQTHPLVSPVVNVIALQLLAYFTAKLKGCPVDFPRNLAKSVTVE
ncbi:MAG: glmS [Chloroflexi bacterium]|nr:glmS [Chloroflexota bacterium]